MVRHVILNPSPSSTSSSFYCQLSFCSDTAKARWLLLLVISRRTRQALGFSGEFYCCASYLLQYPTPEVVDQVAAGGPSAGWDIRLI